MHSKFLEARKHIDCNRLEEARQVLEEYSKTDVLCIYGLYVLVDTGYITDEEDKRKIINQFSSVFSELEALSQKNDLETIYTLGVCYERGYIVNRNLSNAMRLYQKAYKKGHIRAGFNLAYCHQSKNELSEMKKAIEIYKYLAEQDMVEAMTNLGIIYLYYRPCIDIKSARHYLKCAIDKGDALAARHLQELERIHSI